MYRKGLLEFGDVTFDSREDDRKPALEEAWLPHSCDEWIIGGPDEARLLIADLQAYVDIFESEQEKR